MQAVENGNRYYVEWNVEKREKPVNNSMFLLNYMEMKTGYVKKKHQSKLNAVGID